MKNKNLNSLWFSLVLGTLAFIAMVAVPSLQRKSKAQEVQTCHHCVETRLVVEQSAVHCAELPEKLEYYRDRKFSRFQLEVREDENTLEPICEIIAVK